MNDPLEKCVNKTLHEIESEYYELISDSKRIDDIKTWEDMLDIMKNLRNYIDDIVDLLEHKNTDEYFNTCVVVNSNDDEVNDLEAKIHL